MSKSIKKKTLFSVSKLQGDLAFYVLINIDDISTMRGDC